MPIILAIAAILLMIPAGLAGISLGVSELLASLDGIGPALALAGDAFMALLPWCRPLLVILVGAGLVGLAALILICGLQSRSDRF
jgi:hypothetical protein